MVQKAQVSNFCFELKHIRYSDYNSHTSVPKLKRDWRTHAPLMHLQPSALLHAIPFTLGAPAALSSLGTYSLLMASVKCHPLSKVF